MRLSPLPFGRRQYDFLVEFSGRRYRCASRLLRGISADCGVGKPRRAAVRPFPEVMPRKIIAFRKRSATARCDRWVYCDDEPRCYVRCGEPLVLFFSPSPLGGLPYETLVI